MKKRIQELIDENFVSKEVFNDNEDDFVVGGSVNLLDDKIEEFPTDIRSGLFAFKSKVFLGDVVSEPASKRTKVASDGKDFFDSLSEDDSSDESRDSDVDNEDADLHSEDRESVSALSEHDLGDGTYIDESDVEDDLNASGVDNLSAIFSKKILDVSSELEKATAVTNQLDRPSIIRVDFAGTPLDITYLFRFATMWDNLIESRILLQKCIAETNELPQDCTSPEIEILIENLETFLKKLINLQEKIRRETTQQENIGEEDFAVFRNNTIETWYNRMRGARSNSSAFEIPLQKQIENGDLLKKTYLQRNDYLLEYEDQTNSIDASLRIDTETIADDDFYHKLLRNYIKRKTANISDSTQLGRQWLKLHNLRTKMKRRIDTRRTKGRKIKLDPHTKLMNFMASRSLRKWEDESINELCSSVFGKKK